MAKLDYGDIIVSVTILSSWIIFFSSEKLSQYKKIVLFIIW